MMSQYVLSNQEDWDLCLSLVAFSYNISYQEGTGFSPLLLVYGQEPALLSEKWKQLLREAAKNLRQQQEKAKQRYDPHRRVIEYQPGQEVLICTPIRNKGSTQKFLHRWNGPAVVVKKVSPNLYYLKMKIKGQPRLEIVNVERTKPFYK
ncbi:hypothetical protein PR048_031741 [Dryococelus australis]|uniref:Uncharacterized protein n=1 Tax=Dryococelus australis TaxID=614101 RepID=A0ABQ9G744_9NEOP|nr:hypothetical protein PR048_031741 [Dryococelus australis]